MKKKIILVAIQGDDDSWHVRASDNLEEFRWNIETESLPMNLGTHIQYVPGETKEMLDVSYANPHVADGRDLAATVAQVMDEGDWTK